MPDINLNLVDTATPPIPEAQGWARAYDGAAGPLIDLSQAVPGYPAHPGLLERIGEAGRVAASASYGPIAGDAVLREAYAAHVSERYGGPLDPGDVAITTGCNQAFFIATIAVARAGENVILPTPWYFNHKMALDMLGIEARPLPCRAVDGFVPDAAEAEKLIDAGTRAIVLVTPNNPTGAVYAPATIAAFAEVCRRRDIFLILDETYRDFIAGRPHDLFGQSDMRGHLLALYSFSKAYCIPGHRLGALAGPRPVMQEVGKILDTLQICPPRAAQAPLAWAIGTLDAWRAANRAEIERRAASFQAAFAGLDGWRIDSIGSYFAFLHHPYAGKSPSAVARGLATAAGVLTLPGTWFGPGQQNHLRVAFANADAAALGGLRERFHNALRSN